VLQLNNINAALQLLATGAIIVLAAVLQSLVRRREGLGR
jgi:ribose transport system permease protein